MDTTTVDSWLEIEAMIAYAAGAFFAALTAIVLSKALVHLADCIVAGFAFKRRGFANHDRVEVDGELGVISSIGITSTVFRLDENGTLGHDRYRTVSNARLGWIKICSLVPHHRRPKKEAT